MASIKKSCQFIVFTHQVIDSLFKIPNYGADSTGETDEHHHERTIHSSPLHPSLESYAVPWLQGFISTTDPGNGVC
jgi:hypothetical protein